MTPSPLAASGQSRKGYYISAAAAVLPLRHIAYTVIQEKSGVVRHWLRSSSRSTDEATTIRNAGGRLYALSVCAHLLNEPELLGAANDN
ncbi:MAG: hypothetical protein U0175_35000 [Caldilineaceae bacterium]